MMSTKKVKNEKTPVFKQFTVFCFHFLTVYIKYTPADVALSKLEIRYIAILKKDDLQIVSRFALFWDTLYIKCGRGFINL